MTWPLSAIKVVIRGGGDLGSGVAYRLVTAGLPVLITELEHPLLVRRAVSYGSAAIEGALTVDGITALHVSTLVEIEHAQVAGRIPVLVDERGIGPEDYHPLVVVDARMRKRPPETLPLPVVLHIGLGPGFAAPATCNAVIETNRGHHLGRVIRQGTTEPDTGIPGSTSGKTTTRVLRAPVAGVVNGLKPIGAMLEEGDPVAQVGDAVLHAPFKGVLRGLIHDGITVPQGEKIGDLDPRADREYCFTISEKSLAIGGGVLEAILSSPAIRKHLAGLRASR